MVFRDNCYINDLNFGAPYLETNPVAHRCPNGQHVLCDNCLEAEFSMREVTSCLRSKFRSLNLVSKHIRSYSMPHSKDSMVPRCPKYVIHSLLSHGFLGVFNDRGGERPKSPAEVAPEAFWFFSASSVMDKVHPQGKV